MSLKIDLHTHSYFSGDGVSSLEELIATARRKGLHGFALTDHNTCEGVDYLLDRGLIRPDGLPVDDFLIIPGVEVSTAEGHLLCIGAVLPGAGELRGAPARLVCDRIHEAGGLAIPPHAYDYFRAGIRQSVLETLPVDALEVFNAATTFRRCNEKALTYARERRLPMTAGSDAHHETAIGIAYTVLETDDFSVAGVVRQIGGPTHERNSRNETYLTLGDTLRKTWNNWLRLRRRRPPGWPSRP